MNERNDSRTRLWIRERDGVGNTIDDRLVEAAHRVWERARLVVIRYLADDAEAAEILEIAVDSASRAMVSNRQDIQSFEAYLLRSVGRQSFRRPRKQRRIQYVDGARLDRIASAASTNLEGKLDDAKRVELFRACMDDPGRTMFDLRVMGFTWRKIARFSGHADAHSAEVVFHRKMDKALERFRGL